MIGSRPSWWPGGCSGARLVSPHACNQEELRAHLFVRTHTCLMGMSPQIRTAQGSLGAVRRRRSRAPKSPSVDRRTGIWPSSPLATCQKKQIYEVKISPLVRPLKPSREPQEKSRRSYPVSSTRPPKQPEQLRCPSQPARGVRLSAWRATYHLGTSHPVVARPFPERRQASQTSKYASSSCARDRIMTERAVS